MPSFIEARRSIRTFLPEPVPPEVEALGVHAVVTDTLMRDARVAAALARNTLDAVA